MASKSRCAGTRSSSTPDDSPSRRQVERRISTHDQQRQQRIDRRPSGEVDDGAGDQRGDGSQQVAEDVQQRAAGIDAVGGPGEHPRGGDVHGHAGERDDHHHAPGDRDRIEQPSHRFDRDEHDQRQHRQRIDERRQHFRPRVAVRRARRRRPARDRVGEQRDGERRGVGGHVPGVGDQRQRAGQPAADRLDHREARGQPERDPQRPSRRVAVVVAGMGVPMARQVVRRRAGRRR